MADRHPELDAEQAHLDWAYACLEDDRLAFVPVLFGSAPLRVVALRDPGRTLARVFEAGVGPVEMGLFSVEFG
ncbi:MAG: hypothetical protein AAF081_18540, partial [Actinomycetota bacterium]